MFLLYGKTDIMFDLKSNSTSTESIISGYRKSAGLLIIYSIGISLLIISIFNYYPN